MSAVTPHDLVSQLAHKTVAAAPVSVVPLTSLLIGCDASFPQQKSFVIIMYG